jgi:hypothetical protein
MGFVTAFGSARRAMAAALSIALVLASAPAAYADNSDSVIYLDQGWSPELRELFYFTPQGSHLFPYDWFLALEQPESEDLFASPENLARFGWTYHSDDSGRLNPGGLPIGFTREPDFAPGGGNWMGMTCAACHTGTVRASGKTVRIDGGPSMSDFGGFLTALSRAVTVSHPAVNPDKFARFAGRVLGDQVSPATVQSLAQAYLAFAVRFGGRAWMRTPPLHAGPGRVDALTQIVNSLTVFDLGQPENLHPPAAPTSYPFLWLTPKLDWVQWNPIASNPMSRNSGQVLGVFGEANFGLDQTTPHFTSSIRLKNLHELELWINDLEPPIWREDLFGSIDETQWRTGQALFESNCRGCHNMPPFEMTPKEENIVGKQFIRITRIPYQRVGTDPLYVQGLISRFVQTGALAEPLFEGRETVLGAEFFTKTVGAALRRAMDDADLSQQERLAYSDYRFYAKNDPSDPDEPLRSYSPPSFDTLKAGPLLGIWATGPFLHNGSVPNVFELLSPPEERSTEFWVGGRDLDVDRLGYDSSEAHDRFRFDATLPGNRNAGHAYPKRPFTPEERFAVIEFLKNPVRF